MSAVSLRVVLAALLSGAMSFASAGINHVGLLAWFAPLPVLLVVADLGVGLAAAAAFFAAALGAVSVVLAYPRLPPAVLASGVVLLAVPFTCTALAWRTIERRIATWAAVVAYPALVVSAEFLVSSVSPHGNFGSLSYTQGDVPVLLQIASIAGLWGVSFAVASVPAALAVAWHRRRTHGAAMAALALGVAPLALALVFGLVRLAESAPADRVKIGLAASDVDAGRHSELQDAAAALPVVQAYAERVAPLARDGAQIVVLPEKFVGVTAAYADEARAILSKAALAHRVTLVAGFNFVGAAEQRNLAIVFGPDGKTLLEYDKQHLVPGLEADYRRGEIVGLVSGAAAPAIGVAICKDLDFAVLGRAYARAGVGLLLVPAWDFVKDGWLHSRMAVLRGVEGGFAVARSAAEGRLTLSDARGRIVAERTSSEAKEVRLVASLAIAPGGTFYSRTGDWFAWFCVGLVAACGALAWRRR